jgi:flagellar basal-body rod modification protein FlgD
MAVSATSTTNDLAALASASAASGSTTTSAADTSDRFLKLLVAQMQNQDPLNPMDNAEVTTQMAQIQTVQGVSDLNTTMQGLSSQMVQMQALQAASLVGKEVTVPGNQMTMANGIGEGGFALAAAATAVKVDVVSPAGQVIDTMNLGAQTAGVHSFDWTAGTNASTTGLTFRVTATNGSTAVTSTALMQDKVDAVNTSGSTLTLELQNSGTVPYSSVQALN